jgi:hypothetical protein
LQKGDRVVTSVSCVIEKTVEKVYKKAWAKTESGSLWTRRHHTKTW